MASYTNTKETIAYYTSSTRGWTYTTNIWTQFTSEISSSGLSVAAQTDANAVETALSNYANTAPLGFNTYSYTQGNASGTINIVDVSGDYTHSAGQRVFDITVTINATDPVLITVNTSPAGIGTVTPSFLTPLNSTPTISIDLTGSGYTFSYWSAPAGAVSNIFSQTTQLTSVQGAISVTAILIPIGTPTPTPSPTGIPNTPTPTPTVTPTGPAYPTVILQINGLTISGGNQYVPIIVAAGTTVYATVIGQSSAGILDAISLDTSTDGGVTWTTGVMYDTFSPTTGFGATSAIGTHSGSYTLTVRALAADNAPPSGHTSGYTYATINWAPPGQLAVYSPTVVALTNTPLWVETVYPISYGVTQYGVNWGDGGSTVPVTYTASATAENFLPYTYQNAAPGNSFYNVTVNSLNGVLATARTLYRGGSLSGLYIKDNLPTYNVANYFDPTTQIPTLPYQLKDVLIGSNEWAVADVINASFTKLYDNFDYIRNASQALNINNTFYLVEWTAQLAPNSYSTGVYNSSAFAWHTNIAGLNWDNSFSNISATGVADGIIKDIKSYRFTNNLSPDYYTYIAYSGAGLVADHIQVRTNDWRNTLILSAANLGNSIPVFNSLSAIDVIDNELYILDTNTVYKADLVITGALSSSGLKGVQKVGGNTGSISDHNNFNVATDIRACNELLYVADSNNSCVKVYNTALSWVNTIYNSAMSAYSIQHVEVNPVTNNVYALGQTFAPIAPVLTNVSLLTAVKSVSAVSVPDVTVYSVSFVHDGARLLNNTINSLSAFSLYGLINGGQSYTLLTSAVMLSAAAVSLGGSIIGQTQTITYAAASGITYSGFAIKALGNNGFSSGLSNTTPTAANYTYSSPYAVFELDSDSNLVNSFPLPSNTKHISPAGNIQSTTLIKKMVVDPTGAFMYFITPNYIYKYLTSGVALNRITDPNSYSLGAQETFKSGYIDDRLNFFLPTDARVFKYVDIPNTLNLYNVTNVDPLFLPLSAITIDQNEFIQDWVYNKSVLRLLKNHEILYKAIQGRYNVSLDYNGNLIPATFGGNGFTVIPLSSMDIVNTYSIDQNYFVHSNEFVTTEVVNRVLTYIFNLQSSIIKLIKPKVSRQLPSPGTGNKI